MDGKVVDMATINALAAIPALPVLQAQVLGTMLAPITSLACRPQADRREGRALPLRRPKPLPSKSGIQTTIYK